jgi:hypothetical protein
MTLLQPLLQDIRLAGRTLALLPVSLSCLITFVTNDFAAPTYKCAECRFKIAVAVTAPGK